MYMLRSIINTRYEYTCELINNALLLFICCTMSEYKILYFVYIAINVKNDPPPSENVTYKEERDVLEEEMREIHECDMEEFDTIDSSEKTIAILDYRWWPQAGHTGRG